MRLVEILTSHPQWLARKDSNLDTQNQNLES